MDSLEPGKRNWSQVKPVMSATMRPNHQEPETNIG